MKNPASETERKPNPRSPDTSRSIGPESEDRGGPEAPAETLKAAFRRAMPSDPPKPPGEPPTVPDPDLPPPIEEPPLPIPIPPNEPPPPIIADRALWSFPPMRQSLPASPVRR